jgi:hypothetical protein
MAHCTCAVYGGKKRTAAQREMVRLTNYVYICSKLAYFNTCAVLTCTITHVWLLQASFMEQMWSGFNEGVLVVEEPVDFTDEEHTKRSQKRLRLQVVCWCLECSMCMPCQRRRVLMCVTIDAVFLRSEKIL